ncbi:hypothetical protein FQV27_07500 [Paracoccus aurantiacus]|uniref:DUF4405 domain-containing protein n=1 Tax=Paracoccus aurantiacus TaxID=2599412 RepID=A0A5C6S8N1_9RHOB|nr:DUF4405 domain-containing protein [Paracoccus aurantiacus]TXB69944.1 hypothetical protein FQV27_07500 [Paracoccus aurantiacus]
MTGPAASHPSEIGTPAVNPARAAASTVARPRGGTPRSGLQSVAFAVLFVSGLGLWILGQQDLVLWLHLLTGLGLLVWLVPWIWGHVPSALRNSQRAAFTNISWLLLASWVALLLSGTAMAVPAVMWLVGIVWFPDRSVSQTLSLIHFWSSWLAIGGLILHLSLRHWSRERR